MIHSRLDRISGRTLHRNACATGYVKHREGLTYTVIEAMNQFTFSDDAPD